MASLHHAVGPRAYLEEQHTAQSIRLAGRYINLKHMAAEEGFDHSYLSRIMSGERTPSVAYYKRIADALLMPLDELMEAIAERKAYLIEKRAKRLGLTA